ncbi:MAG: T9SS type A sorting domain-containing protein [Chitinophagales bacterium]
MKLCSVLISSFLLTTAVAFGNGNNAQESALDQPSIISGKIYVDMDNNSTFSSTDIGLEAIKVHAFEDINKNGWLDDGDEKVETIETDTDGSYSLTVIPNPIRTARAKISASSDDAVQNEPGGVMILDSESEPGIREIGLRFLDLNIPQGATIKSASLKISIANHPSEFIEIIVKGEANDNPETFINEEYNIGNRPRTQVTTEWQSTVVPNDYQELNIDGIEAIIQEIVDRSGWVEGNAMVLIIADFFGDIYMYDGGFPSELIITYENEDQSDVAYIIAPDLTTIDAAYSLFTEDYQLVKVSANNEAVNNIDFGFNKEVISSTNFNTNELNLATMEIWPKPTTGPINIQLNGLQLDQSFSVNVFSVNGKLVSTEKINISNNNQAHCNLSKLSKGTYIVQLTDGYEFFSEKVILQ